MRTATAWRLALMALILGSALIVVSPSEPPALACSCGRTTVEQHVGAADAVFDMAVTDVIWEDDHNATVYGEVVHVYRGATQQFVSSRLHYGTSCADPPRFSVGAVVIGTVRGGFVDVSRTCGPGLDDEAMASVFEPIIQPEPGQGAPVLIASIDRPGARVAVLDEVLRVSHYGPGNGRVTLIAACPGDGAIVELVKGDFGVGGMTLETRDLASLEVTSVVDIGRHTSTSGTIVDLECHDADGSAVSYLVQRARGEKARQRKPEKAESVIEIWRNGELQELAATDAVAAIVDLKAGVAHVLAPEDGDRVERWSLSSGEVEAKFDLGAVNGVDLAADAEAGTVVVLGAQSDRRPKKHGLGILVQVGPTEIDVKKIKDAARPQQVVLDGATLYTVVKIPNVGMVLQIRQTGGKILEQVHLGFTKPDVAVVPVQGRLIHQRPHDGIRLVDANGDDVVAELDGADVMVGIARGSVEIDAADIPARFELGGIIIPGGDLPPDQPAQFRDPAGVLVALGAAAIVIGIAVGMWRRRRIPSNDGWRAEGQEEGPGRSTDSTTNS